MSFGDLLNQHQTEILDEWIRLQRGDGKRTHLLSDANLADDARTFLSLLRTAVQGGHGDDIQTREWADVRRFLEELSRNRAMLGYSPSQTAGFVFSLKGAIFPQVR